MSVVEEVRQALQDILAPDIREIKARLDAIEDRQRTADTQREIDKQDILRAIAQLSDIMSIKERLARLESAPPPPAHQ